MTANYTAGKGFNGAHSYTIEKEGASLVLTNNLFSDNIKDISKEMREQAKTSRTPKPVFHVSFSFHKDEKISNQKSLEAVEKALNNVGITKENHQYTVVQHTDTGNPHYHVVGNRVGLDGKTHNSFYIHNRLQASCDKTEKDLKLRRTEGRTAQWDDTKKLKFKLVKERKQDKSKAKRTDNLKGKDKIKAELSNAVKETSNKARHWDEFKYRLEKKGFETKISTNKNGVYGLSFRKDNIAIKASSIGVKAKKLDLQLKSNANVDRLRDEAYKKQEVEKAIKEYEYTYQEEKEKISAFKENINKASSQPKYKYPFQTMEKHINHVKIIKAECKAQAEKEAQEREKRYLELKNQKEEKASFFSSRVTKENVKYRNQQLKEQRAFAKANLMSQSDINALNYRLQTKRIEDLKLNGVRSIREDYGERRTGIIIQTFNEFNVSVKDIIQNREAERAERERQRRREEREKEREERNTNRGYKGFSR